MRLPLMFRLDSYWSLVSGYIVALLSIILMFAFNARWFLLMIAGNLIAVIWPLWFTFGAWRLSNELREKGYEWARWWNCIPLQIQAPRSARRVPPHEEIAIVPGYVDSPAGMVAFLQGQTRKGTRDSR